MFFLWTLIIRDLPVRLPELEVTGYLTSKGEAAKTVVNVMDPGQHRRPTVIVLVALLGTYGQTAIGVLPLMLSVWVEGRGFSETTAGLIGSLTLVGMTLGLAMSVLLLRYRTHAWIATAGVIIALSSDTISIFQQAAFPLAVMRTVAGLGYGLVVACVVSWFARHEAADRCFGTFMLLQLLVFAFLLSVIPLLEVRVGEAAPYLCLIFLGIVSLFLVPLLKLNQPDPDVTPVEVNEPRPFLPKDLPAPISIAAVLAPGIVLIAAVGFWAFLQRFGISIGIPQKQLGTILGLITLSGIPASLAVIWIGSRFGRLVPVLIGLGGLLIPMLMFASGAASLGLYVVGGILFTMSWSFSIPTIQAVQSDLDDSGQLAAISTMPQAIGSAIGPTAFAMASGAGGYSAGFFMMILLILVSLVVVIPPTLAIYRPRT